MSKWRNVKRGWEVVNNKNIFFASQGEYRYYLYLDFLKKHKSIKDFEYQPKSFDFSQWIKHGTNRYRVDFKIIENNGEEIWIEIKSTNNLDKMDQKSRTKIKRFKKYYPKLIFRIITTKEIKTLHLGNLIVDWNKWS